MSHFDIVKQSVVPKSYRVSMIKHDYDLDASMVTERFVGDIDPPDGWKIGLIVGNSGTGKSTIARELYGDAIVSETKWGKRPVIDEVSSSASFENVTRTFYSVGFGSVPSWLKPFDVLSNGERMRVKMARALLEERRLIVFDEFTSVVDRNVAKTLCMAVSKAVRASDKQFVGVSCHRDILEYLQPDWYFDTDDMTCHFPSARALEGHSTLESAGEVSGRSFGSITI